MSTKKPAAKTAAKKKPKEIAIADLNKVTGGIAKIAETSSDFAAAKKKKPVRRTSKLAESSDSFDF